MSQPSTHPVTRIPPPILFALTFGIGFLLERQLLPSPGRPGPWRLIGMVLVVAAGLLAGWAVGLFARGRTTLIPHGTSSALITTGPYRHTRNPMYLSLTLAYVGAALWSRTWLALPVIVVPLILLQRYIIPMEEAQLSGAFGAAYDQFRQRVPRWL